MEKIRIQNIKTGQVSEITKLAWEQLRKGGQSKIFDVIPTQKQPVKFVVPTTPEPLEETTIETEFVDIDQPTEPTTEVSKQSKKRGPKSTK